MMVLVGFLALAIDLGMLAIAKTQVQQAADLAALTAARTLNGNATGQLQPDRGHDQRAERRDLQLDPGASHSVVATAAHPTARTTTTRPRRRFSANFPATTGSPTTAVSATVTSNSLPAAFSKIFGDAIPPERHGDRPGGPPPARHRPGDGPLRLDAHGHLPRVRLLYDLSHHQQSRHPRPDVRPLLVERAPSCKDRPPTKRQATTVTRSPRATRPPPTPRIP